MSPKCQKQAFNPETRLSKLSLVHLPIRFVRSNVTAGLHAAILESRLFAPSDVRLVAADRFKQASDGRASSSVTSIVGARACVIHVFRPGG
jgi:hypothetical protein